MSEKYSTENSTNPPKITQQRPRTVLAAYNGAGHLWPGTWALVTEKYQDYRWLLSPDYSAIEDRPIACHHPLRLTKKSPVLAALWDLPVHRPVHMYGQSKNYSHTSVSAIKKQRWTSTGQHQTLQPPATCTKVYHDILSAAKKSSTCLCNVLYNVNVSVYWAVNPSDRV